MAKIQLVSDINHLPAGFFVDVSAAGNLRFTLNLTKSALQLSHYFLVDGDKRVKVEVENDGCVFQGKPVIGGRQDGLGLVSVSFCNGRMVCIHSVSFCVMQIKNETNYHIIEIWPIG